MFEVRVEADFAAAHFLKDYHGKCEKLHGHNYKVFAHARGKELDDGGMLLDFGILKGALRTVVKILDHTNLNDLTENGELVFKNNPSAERIAMWIFQQLKIQLKSLETEADCPTLKDNEKVKKEIIAKKAKNAAELLYAIDVFETETSRARYCVE